MDSDFLFTYKKVPKWIRLHPIASAHAKGMGTWHVHLFFKGDLPLGGITNTFGGGVFFTAASHTRNLNRGNFDGSRVLNVPANGSWYLICTRDDQDAFQDTSQALENL